MQFAASGKQILSVVEIKFRIDCEGKEIHIARQGKIFKQNGKFPMFFRSVGSDVKTGPVRSGLRSRIGLALISVRIGLTKIFSTTQNFSENYYSRSGRCGGFRRKLVEIGAILAIFEPFEARKFRMPRFGEFGRSSQDFCESDYNSHKSRNDRPNSSKTGMYMFCG